MTTRAITKAETPIRDERGFSLVETVIAVLILTVIALGVAAAFVQSVRNNSGNSERTQALAIAQQRIEDMRTLRFSKSFTDSALSGGTKTPQLVVGADMYTYQLDITIDDDPFTAGVQTNSAKTLKEITVRVTPLVMGDAWIRAYPVTIVTRRVRSD